MPLDPQIMQQQRNAITQAVMARQSQGGARTAMPGGIPTQGGENNFALMGQQSSMRGTPGGFFPGTQGRMAPMRSGYDRFMPGGMPSVDQSNAMMQSQLNNPEIQQMMARYQSQMPASAAPPTSGILGPGMPQQRAAMPTPTSGILGPGVPQMQQQQAALAPSMPGMQRGR